MGQLLQMYSNDTQKHGLSTSPALNISVDFVASCDSKLLRL